MNILDLEKRIEELMLSGLYTVVDLSYFKNLDKIQFNENNKEYAAEILETYKAYLHLIDDLPPRFRNIFLSTLKKNEIKHNQEAEDENPFLLDMYQSLNKTNSIDMATGIINRKGSLNSGDVIALHKKILQGTSEDSEEIYGFRKYNSITVEGIESGRNDIHFIPINKKDIPEAMDLIVEYINTQCKEDDILLNPFVGHALIAILQAFPDGNTRLARLISYIRIWQLSVKYNLTAIELPTLYMSANFLEMKGNYRESIRKIVVNRDSAAWNSWFRLNLNAMDEQLRYGINNLEQIKKRM